MIIDYFSFNLVIRAKSGTGSLHIKILDHLKEVFHVNRINTCKWLLKADFPFSSALSINQLNFSNMLAILKIDKYLLDGDFNTMEIAFHI